MGSAGTFPPGGNERLEYDTASINARFEAEAKQLAAEITSTVDLVSWFAALNPDEVGYGQPHAYTPEVRELIRKCQLWQERFNAWESS